VLDLHSSVLCTLYVVTCSGTVAISESHVSLHTTASVVTARQHLHFWKLRQVTVCGMRHCCRLYHLSVLHATERW